MSYALNKDELIKKITFLHHILQTYDETFSSSDEFDSFEEIEKQLFECQKVIATIN